MKQTNKLTETESQYLKMFDRRDIRIRIARKVKNKSKWPLIENWTVYYSEPWTISQMLEKGFNYGIRTGQGIGSYYNLVIDLDDCWAKERIKTNWKVETDKGIHRYFLIKELPKSCWLVDGETGKHIGEVHSKGRFVVGIGSIHESGARYSLKGKVNQKWNSKIESLSELQEFLTERNIKTTPWGKAGLENIRDLELYEPKPKLKPLSEAQKYYQQKAKLEKRVNGSSQKLNICYFCLVSFPQTAQQVKIHLGEASHQQKYQQYLAER